MLSAVSGRLLGHHALSFGRLILLTNFCVDGYTAQYGGLMAILYCASQLQQTAFLPADQHTSGDSWIKWNPAYNLHELCRAIAEDGIRGFACRDGIGMRDSRQQLGRPHPFLT